MLFQPENSKLYYCFFKETAIKTNNVKLVLQAELNQVKKEQKCNFCSFALFMRVYYIYYLCVCKKKKINKHICSSQAQQSAVKRLKRSQDITVS